MENTDTQPSEEHDPQFDNYNSDRKWEPHQERVFEEKRDLDRKLTKLHTFIEEGSDFRKLPPQEQTLLKEQRHAMGMYTQILHERIQRF